MTQKSPDFMHKISRFLFTALIAACSFTLQAIEPDLPLHVQDSIIHSELPPDAHLADTITIQRVIPAVQQSIPQIHTRCLESLATVGIHPDISDPAAGTIFHAASFIGDIAEIPYTLRIQAREGRIRCTIQFSELRITVGSRVTIHQLTEFYPINQQIRKANRLTSWRNMSFAFYQANVILSQLAQDLSTNPDNDEW